MGFVLGATGSIKAYGAREKGNLEFKNCLMDEWAIYPGSLGISPHSMRLGYPARLYIRFLVLYLVLSTILCLVLTQIYLNL